MQFENGESRSPQAQPKTEHVDQNKSRLFNSNFAEAIRIHLNRDMIRREPTMIPMSDSDVQDVRELVAEQVAVTQNMLKDMMTRMENANSSTDEELPALMQAAQKEKDRVERERRLGMQTGTNASISANNASCEFTITGGLD